jgi:hypothetical protein
MSSDSDSSLSSPATSEKRKNSDDNEESGSHSPKSPTQPALIPHASVESTSSSPKSSASEIEKDKKQENVVELEDKRPLEGEDVSTCYVFCNSITILHIRQVLQKMMTYQNQIKSQNRPARFFRLD